MCVQFSSCVYGASTLLFLLTLKFFYPKISFLLDMILYFNNNFTVSNLVQFIRIYLVILGLELLNNEKKLFFASLIHYE